MELASAKAVISGGASGLGLATARRVIDEATVAAFIPLMLMEGDIGDFIRSIPVAVSLMLLGSVTVAHFFTPLLAAWMHSLGRTGHLSIFP